MRVNEIGVIAMNLKEAVEKACQEPTLTEALTWIAVWETGRVVEQVREFERTGISTASHGGSGDTLFKVCFEEVGKQWLLRELQAPVTKAKTTKLRELKLGA